MAGFIAENDRCRRSCRTCDCQYDADCETTEGGDGIPDADFAVFVTAQATPSCGASTGAHAVFCEQDEANWYGIQNRPLAGYINFCPRDADGLGASSASVEALVDTAVHELMHTLFMSSDLFPTFVSAAGDSAPCALAALCPCVCHLVFAALLEQRPLPDICQSFRRRRAVRSCLPVC